MSVSVLILTYNESVNLADCLSSVSFSDDILVVDSCSDDNTVAIAKECGARVVERPFDNYANQRNFGLEQMYSHEWILMLDADERVPEEFADEIGRVVNVPHNPVTLYRMRRKDMFMGRWLKRSSGYPTWFGRLCRRGEVRVEREINEECFTDGEIGLLEGHLLHYPFNKGIRYWVERHNRYSSMEATKLTAERSDAIRWKEFFHKDPTRRRKVFKSFAYRMPFRAILTFLYLYFVRAGFLDGKAGFHFSCMRAVYEYLISLKMLEQKRRERNLPV